MRKANKVTAKDFTAIENLALSWTAATAKKNVRPNEIVAVDWGIINKTSISGKNNVFALYLDLNTGLVFTYPAPSRRLSRTFAPSIHPAIWTASNYPKRQCERIQWRRICRDM